MENEQFSDTTPPASLIPPFPRDSRSSLKVFNPHHLKLRCQRCRHRTPRHRALVPDPSLRDRAIHCITRLAESFFHVHVDLSDAPDLASSHMRADQYLQLRVPNESKPSFPAIASLPSLVFVKGMFNFW
ncbi:hypothetical protein EV1_014413 [Malus domestica]